MWEGMFLLGVIFTLLSLIMESHLADIDTIMSALLNIHRPIKSLDTEFPRGQKCFYLASLLQSNSLQQ